MNTGSLEKYLSPSEIIPLPSISDEDWNAIKRRGSARLFWHFCTLRNLTALRGAYYLDFVGFAWAGMYRTLLVPSITTTSYRNEGPMRALDRIRGTSEFFASLFMLPRNSPILGRVVRVVNLRHHVSGVVRSEHGQVAVNDAYEADFAYVASAFVESLRRGYAAQGVLPESPKGQQIAESASTILYQLAGSVGLRRVPRDLAAHDAFVGAYDEHLLKNRPSERIRLMAQDIARRTIPITAVACRVSVKTHIDRHLDPITADYLFPGRTELHELERQAQIHKRQWPTKFETYSKELDQRRRELEARPEIQQLRDAYNRSSGDSPAGRLIGAMILNSLQKPNDPSSRYDVLKMDLSAGQYLVRQGAPVPALIIVVRSSQPLVGTRTQPGQAAAQTIGELEAPTIVGALGMWRDEETPTSVSARVDTTITYIPIDYYQFQTLKNDYGFRAATLTEVQKSLAQSGKKLGDQLWTLGQKNNDPRLTSLAQLVRYLEGDSHTNLEQIEGLPENATLAQWIDTLHDQAAQVLESTDLTGQMREQLKQLASML